MQGSTIDRENPCRQEAASLGGPRAPQLRAISVPEKRAPTKHIHPDSPLECAATHPDHT